MTNTTNTAAASGAADLSEAQELLVWFAEDDGFSHHQLQLFLAKSTACIDAAIFQGLFWDKQRF